MEEIKTLEEKTLEAVVENCDVVRIVFTTGYQTLARIRDFDCTALLLEVEYKGEKRDWMVYRHAVATIDLS